MNVRLINAVALPIILLSSIASGQKLTSDVPYLEDGHKRHVLDIYTPEKANDERLPVMLWDSRGWLAGW